MSISSLPISNTPHLYHRLVLFLLALVTCFIICINNRNIPMNATPVAYSDSTKQIIINVGGEVSSAGIYVLSANSMTDGVIIVAGVAGDDINLVELAAYNQTLTNGCEINVFIDAKGQAGMTVGLMPVKQRLALGIPLDINEMTQSDFDSVPGIGPELAKSILKYRQSVGGAMSSNELASITGIGTKKYLQLKKFFN